MTTVIQQLITTDANSLDKAIRYYRMLFALNNKKIPIKEIELLAFTAIRGTITPPSARQDFVTKFNSSMASIENLKGKLMKKGYLVKADNKYIVHPKLAINFEQPLIIRIDFNLKESNGHNKTIEA